MMIPNHPFSGVFLILQIVFVAGGITAIRIDGGWLGWAILGFIAFFTMHMSRIYNESSTTPAHDTIINQLAAIETQQQDAAWRNLYTKGGAQTEMDALNAQHDALNAKVELDVNGQYRWKK